MDISSLKEIKIGTTVKVVASLIQIAVTVGSLIWYTAGWKEKVDHRLDDIDRDLKSIHEHYKYETPYQFNSFTQPVTHDLQRVNSSN